MSRELPVPRITRAMKAQPLFKYRATDNQAVLERGKVKIYLTVKTAGYFSTIEFFH